MTDEQFTSIEKYLEYFKSLLEKNNPERIREDTDAIWTLIKEQNEKIDKLHELLANR